MNDKNRVRIYRDDAANERDRSPQEIKEEMDENIERGRRIQTVQKKIIELKNRINSGDYDKRLYYMVFEPGWFGHSLKTRRSFMKIQIF